MEKRDGKDRSSTAYGTAHRKAKADVIQMKISEDWMEENSRSAVQHAGKND